MRTRTLSGRALSLAALVLCFLCLSPTASAQSIPNGSHWFDGSYYYTAAVEGNLTSLTSFNYQGDGPSLTLKKVADEPGSYILSMSNDPEPLTLLRTEIGSRVKYIREDGMKFLAIYNEAGQLVGTLTQTPDKMEDCYSQEDWAEAQPVDDMLDSFLMNTKYLGKFPKETIQQMIKELAAISGKKPGIIAATNLALMRTELTVDEANRVGNEVREILVRNEQEFLQSLGSYRKIILEDGLHLNLSRAIENEGICNKAGILMVEEYADLGERSGLFSEEVFDGRQMVLKGFSKLSIVGGTDCSIIVEPRYSFILRLVDCHDVTLDNLTLGHSEGGYCEGGVVGLEKCSDVNIYRCDMYGCGTYGIEALHCDNVYVSASIIRDCSYGILQIRGCNGFSCENCDFYRNREFDLVSFNSGCSDISFYRCRFSQNTGVLFDLDTTVRLSDCEVHHDLSTIGSMMEISDTNTTWDSKTNYALPSRQIGPDSGAEVY